MSRGVFLAGLLLGGAAPAFAGPSFSALSYYDCNGDQLTGGVLTDTNTSTVSLTANPTAGLTILNQGAASVYLPTGIAAFYSDMDATKLVNTGNKQIGSGYTDQTSYGDYSNGNLTPSYNLTTGRVTGFNACQNGNLNQSTGAVMCAAAEAAAGALPPYFIYMQDRSSAGQQISLQPFSYIGSDYWSNDTENYDPYPWDNNGAGYCSGGSSLALPMGPDPVKGNAPTTYWSADNDFMGVGNGDVRVYQESVQQTCDSNGGHCSGQNSQNSKQSCMKDTDCSRQDFDCQCNYVVQCVDCQSDGSCGYQGGGSSGSNGCMNSTKGCGDTNPCGCNLFNNCSGCFDGGQWAYGEYCSDAPSGAQAIPSMCDVDADEYTVERWATPNFALPSSTSDRTGGTSVMTWGGNGGGYWLQGNLSLGGNFTIEAWVQNPAQNESQIIAMQSDDCNTDGYMLGFDLSGGQPGQPYFFVGAKGGGMYLASTALIPDDNNWYYIAATFDGTKSHLYVGAPGQNYAETSSSPQGLTIPNANPSVTSAPLKVGGLGGACGSFANGFHGNLGEIRFRSYAATPAEIYTIGNPATYQYSNGSGFNYKFDLSLSGNNPEKMTLTNEPLQASNGWIFQAIDSRGFFALQKYTLTTVFKAPGAPVNLSVGSITPTSMQFKWYRPDYAGSAAHSPGTEMCIGANPSGPSGQSGYFVNFGPVGGSQTSNGISESSNKDAETYSASGLTPNTYYQASVAAISAAGYGSGPGPAAPAVQAYTLANPANSLSLSAVTTGSMTLSWSANGNPPGTSYEVSISTGAGGNATIPFPFGPTPNPPVEPFGGLLPNTTYNFSVIAENQVGVQTSVASQNGVPTLALPPTTITPNVTSSTTITWTWPHVVTATSYQATPSPGGPQTVGTESVISQYLTSTSGNTLISLTVAANNASGQGPVSAAFTAYTFANPPSSPAIGSIGTNSAIVSWGTNGNEPGTAFVVQYDVSPTFTFSPTDVGSTGSQATLSPLLPGTMYYVQMKAVNGSGVPAPSTGWLSVGSFTTAGETSVGVGNVPSGFLANARGFHTATLLGDGTVLVAGGVGLTSPALPLELFNPSTGLFATTPVSLPGLGRQFHGAALLSSSVVPNPVLLAGGFDYNGNNLNNATLVSSTTLGAQLALGGTPGALTSAVPLPNGQTLVAGGNVSNVYNYPAGTWSGEQAIPNNHNGAQAVLLGNGKVLYADGFGLFTNAADLFTPGSPGSWSTGAPGLAYRYYYGATALQSGEALLAGGFTASSVTNEAELYNASQNTWTVTGSMLQSRYLFTLTTLPNGMVLAAGGDNGAGQSLATTEIFNPTSGQWSTGPALQFGREGHTATLLNDGRVLLAGGANVQSGTYLTSAELVNVAQGASYSGGALNFVGPDGLTTVSAPAGAFPGETEMFISTDPIDYPIEASPSQIQTALQGVSSPLRYIGSSAREFSAVVRGAPFTGLLASSATISIPYSDPTNSGYVAGYSPPLRATDLAIYWLNPQSSTWVLVPGSAVNTQAHLVSAPVPHFSVYALFGNQAIQASIAGLKVYPIPWKIGSGGPFDTPAGENGLVFDNLPLTYSIKIYTLAGQIVRTLSPGAPTECGSPPANCAVWDGNNDSGRKVASGVYFAVVEAGGSRNIVKLAVER